MSTINSHEYEYARLQAVKPLLSFDGSESLESWRIKARSKLEELLGLPLESGAPGMEIEYEKEDGDFIDVRFTVETEPGYRVPCHLLIPRGAEGPLPLTICLSGHGGGMHVVLGRAKTPNDEETLASWHHRAMGLRAIRDGRCALVIEARNFGESSLKGYGTSCTEAGKIAILMGRTIIGERVWDGMRILDAVLDRYDFLDRSNIVCTGNSGGGTATYYLAAMDERITAAAPSCAVCTYEASIAAMPHCICNHIPQIRKYFEMGDLAGLIAPRKLVIAAGREDTIFPLPGVEETYKTVQRIYEAAGVPERCALCVGDRGHLNYADLIWAKLAEMP